MALVLAPVAAWAAGPVPHYLMTAFTNSHPPDRAHPGVEGTRGYKVAEGPAVLQRNGRLFLTYSASATDANYCLGMLTASASADPLQASSWTKSANPVFVTNASTGSTAPATTPSPPLRTGRATSSSTTTATIATSPATRSTTPTTVPAYR